MGCSPHFQRLGGNSRQAISRFEGEINEPLPFSVLHAPLTHAKYIADCVYLPYGSYIFLTLAIRFYRLIELIRLTR